MVQDTVEDFFTTWEGWEGWEGWKGTTCGMETTWEKDGKDGKNHQFLVDFEGKVQDGSEDLSVDWIFEMLWMFRVLLVERMEHENHECCRGNSGGNRFTAARYSRGDVVGMIIAME